MGHLTPCCDPKKKNLAKKNLNAKLPGNKGTAYKGNRFINPDSNKPGEEKTYFPVKKTGGDIPVVDGCGNFLGILSNTKGVKPKGVRINWGQVKKMPAFDLDTLTDDPASRHADNTKKAIWYVYAFDTIMIIPKKAWLAAPQFAQFNNVKKAIPISAWIPMSKLVPSAKRKKLFQCAVRCIDEIEPHRRKQGTITIKKMKIVDLSNMKWSKSEWWNVSPSDMTTLLNTMTEEAIKAVNNPKLKFKRKTIFPNASVSNKKGAEGNRSVRDYLARSPALPPFLRCVNFLWAIPGSGGVAMDTFPVRKTFHRIVGYEQRTPIFRSGKATGKKITWYYGYVRYPAGTDPKGKKHHDKRYGWMLKNALSPKN